MPAGAWLTRLLHTVLPVLSGDRSATSPGGLVWEIDAAWSADARFAAAVAAGRIASLLRSSTETGNEAEAQTVQDLLAGLHSAAEAAAVLGECAIGLGLLLEPFKASDCSSESARTLITVVTEALWSVVTSAEGQTAAPELMLGCSAGLVLSGDALARSGLTSELEVMWTRSFTAASSPSADFLVPGQHQLAALCSVALGWFNVVVTAGIAEPAAQSSLLAAIEELATGAAASPEMGFPPMLLGLVGAASSWHARLAQGAAPRYLAATVPPRCRHGAATVPPQCRH